MNWKHAIGAVLICALLAFGIMGCSSQEDLVCPECEECPQLEVLVVDEVACAEFIPEPVVCPEPIVCEECPVYDEDAVASWLAEEKAKDLALEELEDEDFTEDLWDYLVGTLGYDIDDADEVEILSVVDSDVDLTDEDDGEGTVELELKVRYIEDGDDDDSHTDRIDVEFDIEDFEVDGYTFSEH